MKSRAISAGAVLALCLGTALPTTTSATSLMDCVNAWNATLDCVEEEGIVIAEVVCTRSKGATDIAVVAVAPGSGQELQAWSSKKNPKEKAHAICHVSSNISGCPSKTVEAMLPGNGYRLWNRLVTDECSLVQPTP